MIFFQTYQSIRNSNMIKFVMLFELISNSLSFSSEKDMRTRKENRENSKAKVIIISARYYWLKHPRKRQAPIDKSELGHSRLKRFVCVCQHKRPDTRNCGTNREVMHGAKTHVISYLSCTVVAKLFPDYRKLLTKNFPYMSIVCEGTNSSVFGNNC